MSLAYICFGIATYCFVALIRECWKRHKKEKRRRRRRLSIAQFIVVKEEDKNNVGKQTPPDHR